MVTGHLAYNITMMYDDSAASFDTMGVFKNLYSQRVYNIITDGYGDINKLLADRGDLDSESADFYNNIGSPEFKEETSILCKTLARALSVVAKMVGDPQYEDHDICVACSKAVNRFASSGRLKNALGKYPRLGGYEWIYCSMS